MELLARVRDKALRTRHVSVYVKEGGNDDDGLHFVPWGLAGGYTAHQRDRPGRGESLGILRPPEARKARTGQKTDGGLRGWPGRTPGAPDPQGWRGNKDCSEVGGLEEGSELQEEMIDAVE